MVLSLDDVNPVGLGRRSRQLFDDVWRRLTDLGQLTSSTRPSDEFDYEKVVVGGPMCDFTTPNAELTTVLVAGATGRVGRILVRKLQLRGYKVKVCAVSYFFTMFIQTKIHVTYPLKNNLQTVDF